MNDKQFQTTSLHLAAVILAEVQDSSLFHIASSPSIDGRRVISIRYPINRDADTRKIIDKFLKHDISVNLYMYNKSLNFLRDKLKNE